MKTKYKHIPSKKQLAHSNMLKNFTAAIQDKVDFNLKKQETLDKIRWRLRDRFRSMKKKIQDRKDEEAEKAAAEDNDVSKQLKNLFSKKAKKAVLFSDSDDDQSIGGF